MRQFILVAIVLALLAPAGASAASWTDAKRPKASWTDSRPSASWTDGTRHAPQAARMARSHS